MHPLGAVAAGPDVFFERARKSEAGRRHKWMSGSEQQHGSGNFRRILKSAIYKVERNITYIYKVTRLQETAFVLALAGRSGHGCVCGVCLERKTAIPLEQKPPRLATALPRRRPTPEPGSRGREGLVIAQCKQYLYSLAESGKPRDREICRCKTVPRRTVGARVSECWSFK